MKEKPNKLIQFELNKKNPPKLSTNAKARLDAIKDKDIDYSDIPDTSELWEKLQVKMPASKAQITLRIDQEVLNFFKAQGSRYQTRMNAVLKAYAQSHKKHI